MTHKADYIDLLRLEPFGLGSLQIHPASREVFCGSARDLLEPRVMQVLVALAQRAGAVVTRDALIDLCWAGRVVGDDAINRCVGRLRRLSETHGGFALETLPRVGYRLNILDVLPQDTPPAEPVSSPVPAPLEPPPHGVQTPPRARQMLHRAVLIAAAAGLLVVALLAWWQFTQPVPAKPVPDNFSIAVLPFTPLYEGAGAQHQGDSISAAVADMLSGYGLNVISPARSFQFRGAGKAKAAATLHADFIIDGEVRREHGMYLVAIRVVAGDSGTTLLADNIERPVSQDADLPENVAGEVAELEWFVTTGFGRSGLWDRRVMAGALRATHLMRTRDDASAANDIARHMEEIAPDDPFAYAIHVRTALKQAGEMPRPRQFAYLAEARKAAATAIHLDPAYADGYALYALTLPVVDWSMRERDLRRALTIMPKAPIGYTLSIEFLQNAGRFTQAARLAEEAYAANPYLSDINVKTVNARLWSGQTQRATDLIRRGSRLFSVGPWFPAKAFEAAAFYGAPGAGEAVLAEPSVRAVLEPVDGPKTFSLIATALKSRRPGDMAAVEKDCLNVQNRNLVELRTCLLALSVLGRLDAAFALTDYLYPDQRGATPDERDRKWLAAPPAPTAYLLTPPAAALRADPRFIAVAERVGLLDYWRSSGLHPDFCLREKIAICRF